MNIFIIILIIYIEKYFDAFIPDDIKININKEFNIDSVKNKISKFPDSKDFDYECKDTLLHGNHIGKYNGETNYKILLNDTFIKRLQKEEMLNKIIDKYNYIVNSQKIRGIILE